MWRREGYCAREALTKHSVLEKHSRSIPCRFALRAQIISPDPSIGTHAPVGHSFYLTERRAEVSEATERSPRTSACARASRLLALPLAIASCAIVGPSSVPSS